MKTIIRLKWLILAVWLVGAGVLFATAPNMEELVRDKGQISIPDGYSSTIAKDMLHDMNGESSGDSGKVSSVLVFHRDTALTSADMDEIKRGIDKLKNGKDAYGVTAVTTHFDMPELAKQMVSGDGKTVLVLVESEYGERTPAEMRDALYGALSDVKIDHYYTGDWLINEDVIQSSQDGLKKTEWITVAFILIILIIVFRSPVAPFVPLLSVGIVYVVSQSVVAYLVRYFDFPLSTFTQIFLVAVLFGIGTDYCILLISRFKEELAHRGDKREAIVETYRTAGKTVLFSGLAVLVGFASIGLSTFVLYRSAVAVAVGVAVLMLALYTIVPFFMAVLGKALFWPVKGSLEHKPSRLWGAVGSFSLKRPVWALVVLAVIIVPFLAAYKGTTSFDSLEEIGSRYRSVKAFEVISDSFGPGESLPSTVVLRSDKPMDTPEGLAAIEQASRELASVDGVKSVRSATRPTGEPLEAFAVSDQVGKVDDGIGQSRDGLDEIGKGLSEASKALGENAPKLQEAAAGAEQLAYGTNELKAGVVRLGDGLKRIEQGLRDGSSGAAELKAGLEQARASAEQLAASSRQLLDGYKQVGGGIDALSQRYGEIAANVNTLAQGLSDLEAGLGGLGDKYPQLKQDPDYARAVAAVSQLHTGASGIASGLEQLNGQLDGLKQGLAQANAGYEQAAAGQSALADGLGKLVEGIAGLQAGLDQAADGQSQIVANIPEMTQGLDRLAAGQKELQSGFTQLNDQLGQLTQGLDQSVSGLEQVSGGLQQAQSFLSGLSASPDKQLAGWHIPEEALADESFRQALDVYMSEDRKTVKFDVVFEDNPYSTDAIAKTDDLNAAMSRALKQTDYAGATYAVAGVTSMNHDLREISGEDYSRTMMLMLVGIAIILALLFRSVVMPIYLILSLLATYYTSMAITEALFVRVFGYSGISWAVPFFGFVMLMALGIDYSIFLMDRFKENRHLPPQEAILKAMKSMGTVIISAAVILGGTFAAMLPAGVLSLLQIATIVLCGLFLYALVMLPLFIPIMVRLFGRANWWPFMGDAAGAKRERGEEPAGKRTFEAGIIE